ncbi:Scr1 family TA system antitoxin-like transcriptional regulator [Streptomyces lydicus]|uniref:DUF397 domain-containing protein n=1 Tax=Streptomyces lydicus TaxID=47763 RepID=UPI0037B84296
MTLRRASPVSTAWASSDEVEQMVRARLKRAELFEQEKPPKLWAILDESVIRRRALPPEQMAELTEHNADAVKATPSIATGMKRSSGIDLSSATWRKSSYSNAAGAECLEVRDDLPGLVPVRDSKDPHGPAPVFPAAGWTSSVAAVKGGQLTVA